MDNKKDLIKLRDFVVEDLGTMENDLECLQDSIRRVTNELITINDRILKWEED